MFLFSSLKSSGSCLRDSSILPSWMKYSMKYWRSLSLTVFVLKFVINLKILQNNLVLIFHFCSMFQWWNCSSFYQCNDIHQQLEKEDLQQNDLLYTPYNLKWIGNLSYINQTSYISHYQNSRKIGHFLQFWKIKYFKYSIVIWIYIYQKVGFSIIFFKNL